MQIVAAADLHGHLPEIPRTDLLLLAGDLLPEEDQERWVQTEFRNWIKRIPARRTIFVAGNHDFYFQSEEWHSWGPDYFRGLGASYLQDEMIETCNLRIWGTPWVPGLPRWAFSEGEDHLRKVPEADIVISHAPPSGILDQVGNQSVGSKALASALQQHPPRLLVCGHIHECGQQQKQIGETLFCNAALCDQKMQPIRAPLCVSLEVEH